MKRKKIKTIVEISAMILATVILLIATDFYSEVKDYKKALGVNRTVITAVYESPKSTEQLIRIAKAERYEDESSIQPEAQEDIEASGSIKDAGISNKLKQQVLENNSIVNILFLGIDKSEDRDEWLGIYRTDTIAFASINLDTKKIHVLSVPRDTYTYLPIAGKMDKINHAYAFGGTGEKGMDSTIEVVNNFVKYSKVNYYFSLDMEPIPQIVDSLGGIELDVEIDMKTYGANLSRGKQVLNGKQAFDYIHWRFSGNGDIDRIFRQQKFMKAMMDKLKEKDQLIHAVKLVLDYKKNIQTDMSAKQILALATLMNEVGSEDVTFYNIPGSGEYINGISYWVPNEAETDEVLRKCFGQ